MAVDRSAEIAALAEALNSGVLSVSVDGSTTVFRSSKDIERRIARLRAEDTVNNYRQKPPIIYANLSGSTSYY